MLKVLELFAGIGACSKALTNLGIPHTIVDAVEVDPYAVKSFNAVNNTNFEPQDITKWDKDIDVDLIMHGSPCQDFSSAGLQAGGDKDSGTRSSLMYETLRIVEKLKPKYVIWENVKNLLSKKHIHNFENYIRQMELLGYNSTYKVLNAKDYGVPQNRERVFTVSIRKDLPYDFHFPAPFPLTKRLKDILEPEVDQSYYLTGGGVTCTPLQNKVCQMALDKKLVEPNDAVEYTYSNARLAEIGGEYIKKQNRGDNKVMSTLKTNPQQIGVTVSRGGQNAIRKLTPKECWRLMGFADEDYEKASKVCSRSQLYKQAGNSIVVDVLEKILWELIR